MKNKRKNAFTLIELLAVIVILAIIALIATPIILGIVEDARKDSFLRSVELVINATDIDIFGKNFNDTYTYTINDGNISNLEVGVKNTEGMNGSIIYDKNGNDIYAIHNGKYCVIKTSGMDKAEIKDYVEGECELQVDYAFYNNGQVVYFDVDKGIGCTKEEYASSYGEYELIDYWGGDKYTVQDYGNSLTGYNGLNGEGNQNSCLLFYAFNDEDGDKVNLILDHNATLEIYWANAETSENTNGPIEVLNYLKDATNSWKGTITPENYTVYQEDSDGYVYGNYTIPYKTEGYKARLITANEVAHITGADTREGLMFDESTTYSAGELEDRFSFDEYIVNLKEQNNNNEITSDEYWNLREEYYATNGGSEYGWLYDRTSYSCERSGCFNNEKGFFNLMGYWTGTSVLGMSWAAWYVSDMDMIDYDSINVSHNSLARADSPGWNLGVRPVIIVSKSKIQPGEAPTKIIDQGQ